MLWRSVFAFFRRLFIYKFSRKNVITSLPGEMLLQVLLKMDNVTLCRLRRTGRFMDSFAEVHKFALAARTCTKRSALHLMLSKEEEGAEPQLKFSQNFGNSRKEWEIMDHSFEKRCSGISITAIFPEIIDQKYAYMFAECLRKLKPKFRSFSLLESIFSLVDPKNPGVLRISLLPPLTPRKLITVIVDSTPEKFCQFLWDIYRSSEEITISEISIYMEMVQLVTFPFSEECPPPLENLGEPLVQPIRSCGNYISNLLLMRIPTKYVLIPQYGNDFDVYSTGRTLLMYGQNIIFVDRNESALEKALVDLEFIHEFPANLRQKDFHSILSKMYK